MQALKLVNGSASVDKTFDFMGSKVSVLVDGYGAPWFVAMELSGLLGYSNAQKMVKLLDDDEVQNIQIGCFGNRGVNIISESGLYAVAIRSNKPKAREFRKWVTAEVLPSIRKTGSYLSGNPQNLAVSEEALKVIEDRVRDTIREEMYAQRLASSNLRKLTNSNAQKYAETELGKFLLDLTGDTEYVSFTEVKNDIDLVYGVEHSLKTIEQALSEANLEALTRARIGGYRHSIWFNRALVKHPDVKRAKLLLGRSQEMLVHH